MAMATHKPRRRRRAPRSLEIAQRAVSMLVAIAFFFSLSAPYAARAQSGDEEPVEVELAPADSEMPAATREVAKAPEDAPEEPSSEPTPAPDAVADDATRPRVQQALPDGAAKSAVTPQAISLPKAEGSIEGMG